MNFIRFPVIGRWFLMMMALAGALRAEASAVTDPREFTDNQGRKMVATIVSIDVTTVVLKRQSDQKEYTFPITQLSENDQVFLATNRAELGKATAQAVVEPLPTRVVTGTEVAKAKRFASEVLLTGQSSNLRAFHWTQRPKLTLKAAAGPLADFGAKAYEDFCLAAGLINPAVNGPEIILCIGTMPEIIELKRKLTPRANRGQTWTWWYEWVPRKQNYTAFVFLVSDATDEAANRRQLFRGMAAVFGFTGLSDEFKQSSFHADSKAWELAEIDRQLVRFFYTFLKSEVSRDTIRGAIEKNWAAMVAPPKPAPAT